MTVPNGSVPTLQEPVTVEQSTLSGFLYTTDTLGKPLLVRAVGGAWRMPGAPVPGGTDPWTAAETGMITDTGIGIEALGERKLLTVIFTPAPEGGCAHTSFVFNGAYLVPELAKSVAPVDSRTEWKFLNLETWEKRADPSVYRMLVLADEARRSGRTRYVNTTVDFRHRRHQVGRR